MGLKRNRVEKGRMLWRYESKNVIHGALVIASILILGAAQSMLIKLFPHRNPSLYWLFIWVNNIIVSLDFFIISWFIGFGSTVAVGRCVKVRTFDCVIWERIAGKPLIHGLGVYSILMPFLMLHSLKTYTPGIWVGIAYGLANIYGFFELSGFLLSSLSGAYTARSRPLGISLMLSGLILLLTGAIIESNIA